MRVENGHGKNKPNIRKFAENDMADGFNSDGLDCESGGQKKTVKVGTRSSRLALVQTELVIKALKGRFPQVDFQMVTMSTRGDRAPAERFWNSEAKRYLSRSSRKLYLKVT